MFGLLRPDGPPLLQYCCLLCVVCAHLHLLARRFLLTSAARIIINVFESILKNAAHSGYSGMYHFGVQNTLTCFQSDEIAIPFD